MGKVRMGKQRVFRSLAGLVEAVELEGIEEFSVARCGGVWYLTCTVEVLP